MSLNIFSVMFTFLFASLNLLDLLKDSFFLFINYRTKHQLFCFKHFMLNAENCSDIDSDFDVQERWRKH